MTFLTSLLGHQHYSRIVLCPLIAILSLAFFHLPVSPNAWAKLPPKVKQQIIDDGIKAGDQDQQIQDLDKQIKKNPPNKKDLEKSRDRLKERINAKKGSAEISGGTEGKKLFDKAREARNKQHRLKEMEDAYKKNPTKKLKRKIKSLKFQIENDYKELGKLPKVLATVTLPLSGVVTPVGGDSSAPFQVFGGYQLDDETLDSFLESQGAGNPKTESTKGNGQSQGDSNENSQSQRTQQKSWTPNDGNPLNMFIGSSKNTFGFQYAVGYQYLNQEAEVWVVAGSDQYLGKWSTYISQQYDGMAIENIEVVLDVTPTFITGLPTGVDPWSFKAHWAQEGFDMTQWTGESLPIGGLLQWKISQDIFSQFTTQAGSKISYFEQDPTTNIAPAPGLSPNTWPVPDDAQPTAHLTLKKMWP